MPPCVSCRWAWLRGWGEPGGTGGREGVREGARCGPELEGAAAALAPSRPPPAWQVYLGALLPGAEKQQAVQNADTRMAEQRAVANEQMEWTRGWLVRK